MNDWLVAIQRIFEDPSRNANAVTTAVAIVVVVVLIAVLLLIAYSLPASAPRSVSPKGSGRSRAARRVFAVVAGVMLAVTGAAGAGALWYRATSTNDYCTRTCHSMAVPTESWAISVHSAVECVRCHEGRPWQNVPRSLAYRFDCLYLELTGDTPRGRPVQPATCLDCHAEAISRPLIARNGERFVHADALDDDAGCSRCHGTQGHGPPSP